jgi:hypothetical protein
VLGAGTNKAAVIGCIFANLDDRSPLVNGGGSAIILNNLLYNNRTTAMVFDERGSTGKASVVGNILKVGPATVLMVSESFLHFGGLTDNSRYYINDNTIYQHELHPLYKVLSKEISGIERASSPEDACWTQPLTVRSSAEAYSYCLANAGARPSDRDSTDKRIINEIQTETGRLIDSQNQVGGFPTSPITTRVLTVPPNPTGDDDNDGYTNVEEWIHTMSDTIEKADIVAARKIQPAAVGKSGVVARVVNDRKIVVQIQNKIGPHQVRLFSAAGSVVSSAFYPDGARLSELSIHVPHRLSGIYFVEICSANRKRQVATVTMTGGLNNR